MSDAIETLRDYQTLRWRKLAERRLEHVTELYDSGRWKQYFGEEDFLEVVKQSKALVATWRKLAPVAEPDARLPITPFAPVLLSEANAALAAAAPEIATPSFAPVEVVTAPVATPAVAHAKGIGLASLLPSPFAPN